MSIEFNPSNTAQTRVTEHQKQEAHEQKITQATEEYASTQTADTVQLTDRARDIQSLIRTVSAMPVVDTQKVEAIQQAIQDGRYKIDVKSIVDKMTTLEKELSHN